MWAALQPSCERLGRFLSSVEVEEDEDSSHVCRFVGTVRYAEVSVDIACDKGDLVVITGPVGSGKSTVLATLARALLPLTGKVIASDQRAYVAQRPFLSEGSIEENILFGLERDEERFSDAVRRAQLRRTSNALSNGLEARVGPAGVQLSGEANELEWH